LTFEDLNTLDAGITTIPVPCGDSNAIRTTTVAGDILTHPGDRVNVTAAVTTIDLGTGIIIGVATADSTLTEQGS
jgi:hypothetical protein